MKRLILLFLCLYLSACSFGSTAYKHLDYVVLWYAADYVSLNKTQKSALSKATNAFTQWHRSNELTKYQQLLSEFKQDITLQKLTPAKANYYRTEIRQFLNNIRDYLEPNLPPLISSLSDKQYQQILSTLTTEINDAKKDNKSIEENFSQMHKKTEQWYGALTQEQLSILSNINQKRELQKPYWQAEDEKWLTAFTLASQKKNDVRTHEIKRVLLSVLAPSDNNDYSEREEWFAVWRLSSGVQRGAILLKLSEYQTLIDDISDY